VRFREILYELLQTVRGSIGAVFVDSEGESVEVVSARPFEADDHGLRVVGAYAGIFLSQLRRVSEASAGGRARCYKIDFAPSRIFCSVLRDGYFVVILTDRTSVEGEVWHRLERCHNALLEEM
jgi:predicted regulator of Ras-like GTPase activity (Roadblock/LC7/MglB family)